MKKLLATITVAAFLVGCGDTDSTRDPSDLFEKDLEGEILAEVAWDLSSEQDKRELCDAYNSLPFDLDADMLTKLVTAEDDDIDPVIARLISELIIEEC